MMDAIERLKAWLERRRVAKNLTDAAYIVQRLAGSPLPDVFVGQRNDGGYDTDVHMDWVQDGVTVVVTEGEVIWAKDGQRSGRVPVEEDPALLALLLSKESGL